jgi:3-dehydroquinate dehydratase/shikimate dehydrogenase
MATLLCVPILVDDPTAALRDAVEARDAGADIIEFRIDPFFSGNEGPDSEDELLAILTLVEQCPLDCIVTCRPVLEGGHYRGGDSARVALFERLGTAASEGRKPPRYIDVELSAYGRSENLKQKVNLAVDHPRQVRELTTELILSTHDFVSRPGDLIRQLEQMLSQPAARVVKVAYRARSLRDNLELLDILREVRDGVMPPPPIDGPPPDEADADVPNKRAIALGMGPFGLLSRVLAPKYDAFLTFASLRRDTATAPGQPIISELLNLYRFRSIRETTRVLGVVGYPVEHSISPCVHNAGFEALGFDAVYLPLPVPPEYEHFKATLLALIDHATLDFSGCSVTIPHKEHLVRLAREQRQLELDAADGRADTGHDERRTWHLDRLSDLCGAANTLVIRHDNRGRPARLEVLNTDGPAAISAIEQRVGSVRGRTIALLGTGGTSRSLAVALADAGAKPVFVSRTAEKARALVSELRVLGLDSDSAQPDALAPLAPMAIVNCTPVGMTGGPDPDNAPLSPGVLRAIAALPNKPLIADAVYRPRRTPLIIAAADLGLPTLDGVAMFLGQAAEQFRAWTQSPAPMGLFERVASEALAPAEHPAPPSPPHL